MDQVAVQVHKLYANLENTKNKSYIPAVKLCQILTKVFTFWK